MVDFQDHDIPCPKCRHSIIHSADCELCEGEGHREYIDAPDEWGEDCPSEVNHLLTCRDCEGSGLSWWCPKCGARLRSLDDE